MFIGEYQHNLDDKGRIIVPSKFRDELNNTFMLAPGFEQCLTIYSLQQWNNLMIGINKMPTTKADVRKYIRTLFGKASECSIDNQGRIQIPSYLLEKANITKECSIVGVNDHIEIWDKTTWDNYYEDASSSFEEIAEHLSELVND